MKAEDQVERSKARRSVRYPSSVADLAMSTSPGDATVTPLGDLGDRARPRLIRIGREWCPCRAARLRRPTCRGAMPAGTRVRKLRIGLQRLPAHRTRRREQGTLSKADVVIEKIDDAPLMLDPVDDQIDAETAEQIGEAGGMDIGGSGPNRLEQHICMHLDVLEAALGKLAGLEVQARDVIHRKSKAVLG